MANELQVTYTVIARTKNGRTLHRKGMAGTTMADPFALREALAEVFYFVLDEFTVRTLGKDDQAYANLSRITVRFEDIEAE